MPDNTLSTLEQIKIKIRRITRKPTVAHVSEADLEDYINTFVLYDFPQHTKVFRLRETVTFFTEPYVDTYTGDEIVTNFDNLYTAIYTANSIAGREVRFTQNYDQFYAEYPKTEQKKQIGTGNAVLVAFTGTLSAKPVLRNHVSFTSISATNAGIECHDDGAGSFTGDVVPGGTIDYVTGAYTFTFSVAPGNGETVYSQTAPYSPGLPSFILYHGNTLTFRQVPDQPYRVELEVARRPIELLNDATMPELSQWFQFIALGSAIKIFQDQMDMDSVNLIMPEFKQQETLVMRSTYDLLSKQRSSTIYSNGGNGYNDFFNDSGR